MRSLLFFVTPAAGFEDATTWTRRADETRFARVRGRARACRGRCARGLGRVRCAARGGMTSREVARGGERDSVAASENPAAVSGFKFHRGRALVNIFLEPDFHRPAPRSTNDLQLSYYRGNRPLGVVTTEGAGRGEEESGVASPREGRCSRRIRAGLSSRSSPRRCAIAQTTAAPPPRVAVRRPRGARSRSFVRSRVFEWQWLTSLVRRARAGEGPDGGLEDARREGREADLREDRERIRVLRQRRPGAQDAAPEGRAQRTCVRRPRHPVVPSRGLLTFVAPPSSARDPPPLTVRPSPPPPPPPHPRARRSEPEAAVPRRPDLRPGGRARLVRGRRQRLGRHATPTLLFHLLQARSMSHWSPYDRVGVVNAVP